MLIPKIWGGESTQGAGRGNFSKLHSSIQTPQEPEVDILQVGEENKGGSESLSDLPQGHRAVIMEKQD